MTLAAPSSCERLLMMLSTMKARPNSNMIETPARAALCLPALAMRAERLDVMAKHLIGKVGDDHGTENLLRRQGSRMIFVLSSCLMVSFSSPCSVALSAR